MSDSEEDVGIEESFDLQMEEAEFGSVDEKRTLYTVKMSYAAIHICVNKLKLQGYWWEILFGAGSRDAQSRVSKSMGAHCAETNDKPRFNTLISGGKYIYTGRSVLDGPYLKVNYLSQDGRVQKFTFQAAKCDGKERQATKTLAGGGKMILKYRCS